MTKHLMKAIEDVQADLNQTQIAADLLASIGTDGTTEFVDLLATIGFLAGISKYAEHRMKQIKEEMSRF